MQAVHSHKAAVGNIWQANCGAESVRAAAAHCGYLDRFLAVMSKIYRRDSLYKNSTCVDCYIVSAQGALHSSINWTPQDRAAHG